MKRRAPRSTQSRSSAASDVYKRQAILAADGVDENSLNAMKKALEAAGAQTKIIAAHLGFIAAENGKQIKVDQSFLTAASVLFDAVYVPDGAKSASLLTDEPD